MESSIHPEHQALQIVRDLSRAIHEIVTFAQERISADEGNSASLLVDVAKQSVIDGVTCLSRLRSELIRADGDVESLSTAMNSQSKRHEEWTRIQSSPAMKDEQAAKKVREKIELHRANVAALEAPLALARTEAELLQTVDRAAANEILILERLATQIAKEVVEPVDSQVRVDAWRDALVRRLIEMDSVVEQVTSAAYDEQFHSQK